MKTNYEKLENATSKLNIVIEDSDMTDKEELNKALEQLGKNITIPGFRKGKAPANMVQSKVNPVELVERIRTNLINKAYREAIKKYNIRPAFQPSLKVLNEEKEFEVEIEIITYPEVTLGAYKDIEVKKESVEVTDKEVDDKVQELLNRSAEYEIVEDGILEKGNIAIIDFEGFVDGAPFEGGSATNYSLEIGSNTFIPGFEDQLIGMKKEEDGEVNVTFPENYGGGLANKAAVFKVKLHEIKRKVFPELNDEFAKEADIEGVNTVADLKKHLENDLLETKKRNAENKQQNELIEKVCANATLEINDKYVERDTEALLQDFKLRLQQQGLSYEDYLKMTGTKEEDLNKQAREESLRSTKQYFTLNKIAEVENITVSDEDLEAELQKMADANKLPLEKVKEYLKNRLDSFRTDLRINKVLEFLKQNNKLDA